MRAIGAFSDMVLILVLALTGPIARASEPTTRMSPAPAPATPSWPAAPDPDPAVQRVQAPPPTPGPTAPAAPLAAAPTPAAVPAAGLTGLAGFSRRGVPQMLGDNLISARQQFPAPPGVPPPFPPTNPPLPPSPRQLSALVPSVRGFKIAENQSPQPQDRLFYSFNYFARVNEAVNRAFDSPVGNLRVYRHIFGLEKTFDDARGSFGLRLPLNTLTGDSTIAGRFARPGGTDTALGDLSIFAKYVLKEDRQKGNLISAGFVVTPPTGPDTFAGSPFISSLHTTTFQPFLGYIRTWGDFYVHGFTAFDFPADPRDVTILYNDVGFGYFLLRSPHRDAILTAVAPTFEVHVNTPLNHRDPFDPTDIAGTPDVVNLTYGVNFEFVRTSVLTLGFVTPVTGPKPFDYEATLLLNIRFGGTRRPRTAGLPIIGG